MDLRLDAHYHEFLRPSKRPGDLAVSFELGDGGKFYWLSIFESTIKIPV